MSSFPDSFLNHDGIITIFLTNVAGSYSVTVTKMYVGGSATSASYLVRSQWETQLDGNFIVANTPTVATVDENLLDQLTSEGRLQTVQYFDGLGRPIQTVSSVASPNGFDIVQPTWYDDYGRQDVNYLPYTSAEKNGWYKPDPTNKASSTYGSSAHFAFYNDPVRGHSKRQYAFREDVIRK